MTKASKGAEEDYTGASDKQRYRAPALEKGLDILELLATERHPLTISTISQRLGRSMSELFRMVQVLEYRGFIMRAENGEGLVPTDKLFTLGMERPSIKNLLELSLPVMRDLSSTIGQSCHLAVRSGRDIVVVARMESEQQIGVTVPIGYRRIFIQTGSGAILFAFQRKSDNTAWLDQLPPDVTKAQIDAFHARAERARARGYERANSEFMTGVTDLAAPVLRGSTAAAALAVPFGHSTQLVVSIEEAIKHLCACAARISSSLLVADHRV